MIKAPLLTLVFMTSAGMARADGCEDLGLPNAYLTEHFCMQLRGLTEDTQATRSLLDGRDRTGEDDSLAPWESLPILQDAYRADPKKTLALIERIRNAGGLANE